jgi:hypothetical protein
MENINKDIFNIDQTQLDKEWVEQPKLFFEYAVMLADERSNLERRKAQADLVRAELDKQIREDPVKFGLGSKLTETAINNTITENSQMQKANTKIRLAKHRVDVFQAAVNALDQRKSALERLVSLHGQNYFSQPTVTDNEKARDYVDNIKKKKARVKVKGK